MAANHDEHARLAKGTQLSDRARLEDAPTQAAATVGRASLIRRAFLPSPLEEKPGPIRIHAFARLRAMVIAGALGFDVALYLMFRGSPHFDQRALGWFMGINVPLLVIAGLLGWFPLSRQGRYYMQISYVAIALECFTCATWIQLTGSVSSYFLIAFPLLTIGYRLYGTYRLGLTVYVVGAVMHAAMVALETAGTWRPASLFVENPGAIYEVPLFRLAATISVQMMFMVVFVIANIVARTIREKEDALDEAQRNLDRAVADAQPGRLSGAVLDGKYRLGELLGRGGMGEVYQAERLTGATAGDRVAVKVLHAHYSDADHLERFRREAAIAAKLPSRHVVQVHDVGHSRDGGHHYLVMELLRGEDLGTLLRRRGALPPAELLPLIDQLVTALDAAHALGIVHRDLKPQNVFITSVDGQPHVKLLDFGVARMVEGTNLTATSMLIGSPGYLAPEQVDADFGEIGPQVDVFALGTIVYRALTGHAAFPARNAAAAVYEAVHRDPPAPSSLVAELGPDVDCVLALALAKKPEERYGTPRELAADLRVACDGKLDESRRARARSLAGRTSAPGLAPTLAAVVQN